MQIVEVRRFAVADNDPREVDAFVGQDALLVQAASLGQLRCAW